MKVIWLWDYLMKVILPDEGYSTWWRLFYLMKVILPDEGYSTSWRLFYLMKVILPHEGYSTWWRLFYLMKVIPENKFDISILPFYSTIQNFVSIRLLTTWLQSNNLLSIFCTNVYEHSGVNFFFKYIKSVWSSIFW